MPLKQTHKIIDRQLPINKFSSLDLRQAEKEEGRGQMSYATVNDANTTRGRTGNLRKRPIIVFENISISKILSSLWIGNSITKISSTCRPGNCCIYYCCAAVTGRASFAGQTGGEIPPCTFLQCQSKKWRRPVGLILLPRTLSLSFTAGWNAKHNEYCYWYLCAPHLHNSSGSCSVVFNSVLIWFIFIAADSTCHDLSKLCL